MAPISKSSELGLEGSMLMLLRGMVTRNSTFVLAGVEAAGAVGQRLGAARGRRWGARCKQERKLSHSSQPREPSLDRETETPDSRSRRGREYCPVHRRPRPSDPASRACDRRVARKIPACSKSLRRPRRTQPGLARRPGEFLHPVRRSPKPDVLQTFARDGIMLKQKLELSPGT